jgi:hypothetical protein
MRSEYRALGDDQRVTDPAVLVAYVLLVVVLLLLLGRRIRDRRNPPKMRRDATLRL